MALEFGGNVVARFLQRTSSMQTYSGVAKGGNQVLSDTETTVRACQLGVTFPRRLRQVPDTETNRVAAGSGSGKGNSQHEFCWFMTNIQNIIVKLNRQILYLRVIQHFTAHVD